MLDYNKIEPLLAAFYKGDTTLEEEKALLDFFNSDHQNEQWNTDKALFCVLYDSARITLPEGISERIESVINSHIKETYNLKTRTKTRTIFMSILSAAAVALLCFGLFFVYNRHAQTDCIADTYTNPEEATIAAEKALQFVSVKLNQGLAPLGKIKESVIKTNEIINENFMLN